MRHQRAALGAILGLSLVGTVAEAFVPLLIGNTLQAVVDPESRSVQVALATLAICMAVWTLTNVWKYTRSGRLRIDEGARIRERVAESVTRGALGFAAKTSPARVSTVVSADIPRVVGYPLAWIRLLSSVLGALVVATYLVATSPRLSVLVLIGIPALMLLSSRIAAPLESRQESQRELLGTVTELSADVGLGARTLRGIGGEAPFLARFTEASRASERAGVAVARTEAQMLTSSLVAPGLFLLALVWAGGHLAQSGAIAATDLVTFYAASAYLVVPIETMAGFAAARAQATVAVKNVNQTLEPSSSEVDGKTVDVEPNQDMFDSVTGLTIPGQKFTVIVPPSSAYARDLGLRLAGLCNSSEAASIGLTPLCDVESSNARRLVRYQGSRITLFPGRVRDAVDPQRGFDDELVAEALFLAVADEIVERLPARWDEFIAPDGRSLSGGQRQRIALARSLLGRPPYLVLVNPTTALDTATEMEVAQRLRSSRSGLTTVVITASPAFQSVADCVLNRVAS
jgi:ABC-type multidrug transport system fused ATPase/permease subunit